MNNDFNELGTEISKWGKAIRSSENSYKKIGKMFSKIFLTSSFKFIEICVGYPNIDEDKKDYFQIYLKIKELILPSEFEIIDDSGYFRNLANTCVRNITVCIKSNPKVKFSMEFTHYFDINLVFVSDWTYYMKYKYNIPSGRMGLSTKVKISSVGEYKYIHNESYKFSVSELKYLLPEADYYMNLKNQKEMYENNSDVVTLQKKGILPEFNKLIESLGEIESEIGVVKISIKEKFTNEEEVVVFYKDSEGVEKSIGTISNLEIERYEIIIECTPKGFNIPIVIGIYSYKKPVDDNIDLANIIKTVKLYKGHELWEDE